MNEMLVLISLKWLTGVTATLNLYQSSKFNTHDSYLLLSGKNKLKALYLFILRCCSCFTYPWAWFSVLTVSIIKCAYFDKGSPIMTK